MNSMRHALNKNILRTYCERKQHNNLFILIRYTQKRQNVQHLQSCTLVKLTMFFNLQHYSNAYLIAEQQYLTEGSWYIFISQLIHFCSYHILIVIIFLHKKLFLKGNNMEKVDDYKSYMKNNYMLGICLCFAIVSCQCCFLVGVRDMFIMENVHSIL